MMKFGNNKHGIPARAALIVAFLSLASCQTPPGASPAASRDAGSSENVEGRAPDALKGFNEFLEGMSVKMRSFEKGVLEKVVGPEAAQKERERRERIREEELTGGSPVASDRAAGMGAAEPSDSKDGSKAKKDEKTLDKTVVKTGTRSDAKTADKGGASTREDASAKAEPGSDVRIGDAALAGKDSPEPESVEETPQQREFGKLIDFLTKPDKAGRKTKSIRESNADVIIEKHKKEVLAEEAASRDDYPPAFSYDQPEMRISKPGSRHIKGGPALPKRYERPAIVVQSLKLPSMAGECLVEQLTVKFRLPANFYNTIDYQNGSKTVSLYNPYSKNQGLYFDIEPTTLGSEIRLYAKRAMMSTAWIRLPEACK